MYAAVKMAGVEKGGGGGDGGVDMTPADREKLGEMMVFPTKDVPPKMKKGLKVSCIQTYMYTVYVYIYIIYTYMQIANTYGEEGYSGLPI